MTDSEPAAVGRENDEYTFHRCDECGSIVVQLSTHRCPTRESPSTRTERERRAGEDERDPDDLVGVYRRSNGHTYAYHELDENHQPCCPTRNPSLAQRFEVTTRDRAQELGKSPVVTVEILGNSRIESRLGETSSHPGLDLCLSAPRPTCSAAWSVDSSPSRIRFVAMSHRCGRPPRRTTTR